MNQLRLSFILSFLVYFIMGNSGYGESKLAAIFCIEKLGFIEAGSGANLEESWLNLINDLESGEVSTHLNAQPKFSKPAVESCLAKYENHFMEAEFILKGRNILRSQAGVASAQVEQMPQPNTHMLASDVGVEGFGNFEIPPQIPMRAYSVGGLGERHERYAQLWDGFLIKLRVLFTAPL